jgi:uncharacterized membrane protein YfcA
VSVAAIVVATLVVAVGASIQGTLGFGLGLIAAPILALLDPALVPGPLLFSILPLSVLVARRERGSLDLEGVRWAIIGRIPGTVLGVGAIAVLSQSALALMVGVVVLVAVALSVAGWQVTPSARTLATAGAASGFMGTATSIGGPPIAMVYQRQAGPEMRASLAAIFLFGGLLSVGLLVASGEFWTGELRHGLLLVPGVLVGYVGSGRLAGFLDRGYTRTAVLALSAVSAAALIVRELL